VRGSMMRLVLEMMGTNPPRRLNPIWPPSGPSWSSTTASIFWRVVLSSSKLSYGPAPTFRSSLPAERS
jgi:hypothetical protein